MTLLVAPTSSLIWINIVAPNAIPKRERERKREREKKKEYALFLIERALNTLLMALLKIFAFVGRLF